MNMIFNFFATQDEVYDLWDWIGELDGMQLVEADSRPDRANREFEHFPRLDWETRTPHSGFTVVAWDREADTVPQIRDIQFEPRTASDFRAGGRTALLSPAFFRLCPIELQDDNAIGPVELIYWTEKLAVKSQRFDQEHLQRVDWSRITKHTSLIKREIKARSVGNWRAVPVSKGVAVALSESGKKLWLWGATGTI